MNGDHGLARTSGEPALRLLDIAIFIFRFDFCLVTYWLRRFVSSLGVCWSFKPQRATDRTSPGQFAVAKAIIDQADGAVAPVCTHRQD
jgi:hypothetical protein